MRAPAIDVADLPAAAGAPSTATSRQPAPSFGRQAAAPFLDPAQPVVPAADVACCLAVDRFDLAMPVTVEAGHRVIRPRR